MELQRRAAMRTIAAGCAGVVSLLVRASGGLENGEVAMSKFMILYRTTAPALEQMANATPEQREAGMQAWQAWASKVSYAVVDLGAPLAHTTHVGQGAAIAEEVAGYSILQAGSADEIETILDGHPHLSMPENSIEVLEIVPIADM